MSITVCGSSRSGNGGIKKERLGLRKISRTPATSRWLAFVKRQSVARLVGRRIPRTSVPLSVNALNIFSQIFFSRSLLSSPYAFSACRSSACAMVPIDS